MKTTAFFASFFTSALMAVFVAGCSDDSTPGVGTPSPSASAPSPTPTSPESRPDASVAPVGDASVSPSKPNLAGTWRTGCAPQQNGTQTIYTVSEVSEKAGTPRFTFTAFGDAACTVKLFSLGNENRRTLGSPVPEAPGAFELDVSFTKLFAVAHSPEAAAQLRSASCGTGDFVVDQEKDVTQTGCLFFEPISACPADYDIVKVEGDKLYNGARAGNQCVVAGRPKTLNAYFFAKVQ